MADKLKRLGAFFQGAAGGVLGEQGDKLASALEAISPSRSLIDKPEFGERYARALERREGARSAMEDEYPAESTLGRFLGYGLSPIPKAIGVPMGLYGAASAFRKNLQTPASEIPAQAVQEAPQDSVPVGQAPTPLAAEKASRPLLAPRTAGVQTEGPRPSGPFPQLTPAAVPKEVLEKTPEGQPLIQWTDAKGVTHLINNPKFKKQEPAKKPFIPPRLAVVQALKSHGVDSEYALEQLEQNPQALGDLLADLVSAGKDSETMKFLLPALTRGSNSDALMSLVVAQNTGKDPGQAIRDLFYDTPEIDWTTGKPTGRILPGLISETQAPEGVGETSNQQSFQQLRAASALVRSFLDEAKGKPIQGYRPVNTMGSWTGGGGVPIERAASWSYEPFEPEYGE